MFFFLLLLFLIAIDWQATLSMHLKDRYFHDYTAA